MITPFVALGLLSTIAALVLVIYLLRREKIL